MSCPRFFVLARVVGRDGALAVWKNRLVHLCAVSVTERYGDSYYWGADLDGEPDTIWGLEGYTHPLGFFIDHVSSDVFKREMALVDQDALLRHQQGLTSPDYDLHHYDEAGGFLKRWDDLDRDATTSHVAAFHFWAADAFKRAEIVARLAAYAAAAKTEAGGAIQSCLVLRELKDETLASLWFRTKSRSDFDTLHTAGSLAGVLADVKPLYTKTELHQSASFTGHISISN